MYLGNIKENTKPIDHFFNNDNDGELPPKWHLLDNVFPYLLD